MRLGTWPHFTIYFVQSSETHSACVLITLKDLQRCPLFLLGSTCFGRLDGRPYLQFRSSALQLQHRDNPPAATQMNLAAKQEKLYMLQEVPAWSLSDYSGRDAAGTILPTIHAIRKHSQWSRCQSFSLDGCKSKLKKTQTLNLPEQSWH